VPGKNVRKLAGHPLIAYSIAAARASEVFDAVIVSTDSEEIAEVAARYGADVPGLRPAEIASSTSPDIEWVRHVLGDMAAEGRQPELFSILRPTSPFRGPATIRRAYDELLACPEADSIRAVELCRQHPGKMWTLDGELMRPLLPQSAEGVPTHSRQYQDLSEIYVQNSSLEIAWTRAVTELGSIAGDVVAPFFTDQAEGFTIDYPSDWAEVERMVSEGEAALPAIDRVTA
jgi:N-acylneuraminate cytidylyltransferase